VSSVIRLAARDWTSDLAADTCRGAAEALERGDLLYFERLPFPIEADEGPLFTPGILSTSKNASFDPSADRLSGTSLDGADRERLRSLMTRFSRLAAGLADRLLPGYRGRLEQARSSFRPAEIAGRVTSWRKDDSRLHIDSFPASPVHGRRILRIFTNVNPAGRPRIWRVGEDFERLVERFGGRLPMPWAGSATLLWALRMTKTRRSLYDALMLALHDRMKEDTRYQREASQVTVDFPAGATWVAFTDYVSHAAMAGQYQLEQTFLLPVDAMLDAERSPLRILERAKGRRLA
jgi:hypothetical protein